MKIDVKRLESFLNTRLGTGLLFVIWTLFITNLWLPRNWGFYGSDDWDLTYATFESARKSIVEFNQWPGFNPYLAFGSDMDANPQSAHASIFFLPILLFGTFYGYKVSIILAILLGLYGMRLLLKSIGINPLNSTLISMLFCSASYFARHIMEAGHSNFLNFYLIPFLFYFLNLYKNRTEWWSGLLAALILTQFISSGAPIVFIITFIMIMLWILGLALNKEINIKQIASLVWIMIAGLSMSLWKIVPVLDQWSVSPRLVTDDSSINPLILLHAFADFKTDTGTPHGWHEVSLGIGLIIPILILFYRKHIPNFKTWFIIGILCAWFCLGNTPSYINPWYLIHHYLPIFDGIRAPYRFLFILLFAFVLGLGFISKIESGNKLIVLIIVAVSLSNTLNFNSIARQLVFTQRIEEIPSGKSSFPNCIKSNKKQLFFNIRENNLIVDAYEPQDLPIVTDTLQQFTTGAKILEFTPNKLQFISTDSSIKINLRYHSGWKSTLGNIENNKGLIQINDVVPNQTFTLSYSNPKVRFGLYCTFISLVITLAGLLLIQRLNRQLLK